MAALVLENAKCEFSRIFAVIQRRAASMPWTESAVGMLVDAAESPTGRSMSMPCRTTNAALSTALSSASGIFPAVFNSKR